VWLPLRLLDRTGIPVRQNSVRDYNRSHVTSAAPGGFVNSQTRSRKGGPTAPAFALPRRYPVIKSRTGGERKYVLYARRCYLTLPYLTTTCGYLGQPSTGLCLANDCFNDAFQFPLSLRTSGFGPGVDLYWSGGLLIFLLLLLLGFVSIVLLYLDKPFSVLYSKNASKACVSSVPLNGLRPHHSMETSPIKMRGAVNAGGQSNEPPFTFLDCLLFDPDSDRI
jgi:hypothetical protein